VYNDIDTADLAFIRRFDGYTMTSIERRFHLLNAVRYLVRHQIPGAIVECGVWRGGSMMLAAGTLLSLGVCDRDLHLFDTYTGMPPPAALDVDFEGKRAGERMQADAETRSESLVWAIASLREVTKNMVDTGYPANLLHYVEGRVEETLPKAAPERIALLRLDTDWYESTHHELIHLYPRLVRGGVLIIDDYGYWKGARKAVDEFLAVLPEPVLLHRIDDTGRAVVKP
jgi:O-methyltransferase